MSAAAEVLLVITNLPDRASAERLADKLVAQRLAACVNILAPADRSTAEWTKSSTKETRP